ncbi:MAG: hypothetical protein A2293_13215 [Elusimicrobia bacterium RIFOXYB2_FULL_49_7]|nr:MAG: hypothetical protein A2293_13215 [Elusimicrobia bacterium RIFOXYB2_FULL_49_7]
MRNLILLFTCLYGLISCTEIPSVWRKIAIIVDGSDKEWINTKVVGERGKVGLSAVNDSTDFYIRLTVWDKTIQHQILHSGITVWFDTEGNSDKRLGLYFPMKMAPQLMSQPQHENKGMLPDFKEPPPEALIEQNDSSPVMIRQPNGNDSVRLTLATLTGAEMRMGFDKSRLVVELRTSLIPLHSRLFAVQSGPDNLLGVGLEAKALPTPPDKGKGMGGPPGGNGMGGGMGGPPGGNGMGGGMGGPPGGNRMGGGMGGPPGMSRNEEWEFWVTFKLSISPDSLKPIK